MARMKNGLHGISRETFTNLLIDAGKLVVNYGIEGKERALGATMGGNTFAIETEYKDIRPDGSRGKQKGGRRIVDVNPVLTVNLMEITAENLKMAMPGSAISSGGADSAGYSILTRTANIADEDYMENVALVGTISGKALPVIIIIKNALNDGNLELALEDKEEGVTELTLSAHFDPEAQEAEPWEIRYPTAPNA